MRPEIVHSSHPASLPQNLPLKLEQKAANAGPIIMLMIMVPLAGALLAPFLLLAQAFLLDGALRANLLAHPVTAAQLVIAFGIWCGLFAWPIKRLAAQLGRTRSIDIESGTVRVTDRTLLSTTNWQLPISEYEGINHRVRSSLSGVRHELVLTHADGRRNVVLAMKTKIAESEIAEVRDLFFSTLSPAHHLYRRLEEAYAVAATEQFVAPGRQAA